MLQYKDGEIIKVESDHIFARNSQGEFCKIPKNKFSNGEIVQTTAAYYSPKSFTRLVSPTYTENRGWVYGENYIDREGGQGGCGYFFEEEHFLPLTDGKDILLAKRLQTLWRKKDLQIELNRAESDLEKINYCLGLINS